MTVVTAAEVLEPRQRSLRELADDASREHELVVDSGVALVEHAILAGDALREAHERVPFGMWMSWLREHVRRVTPNTAMAYMRVSRYQAEIRSAGIASFRQAQSYLAEIEAPAKHNKRKKPEWLHKEASRLKEQGLSYRAISRELGVSRNTVQYWLDPKFAQRRRADVLARQRRRQEADRAAKKAQRDAAIKRAVRKAGAATQEAWAMAERMQDVLAQAQRETEDREAREALSHAGVHYRKMRDEIVRALGVA